MRRDEWRELDQEDKTSTEKLSRREQRDRKGQLMHYDEEGWSGKISG